MSEIRESLSLIKINETQKDKIYTNIIDYKIHNYSYIYNMALSIILILVCIQNITLVEDNNMQVARIMVMESEDYIQNSTYECNKCMYSNYNRMGDIK